MKILLPLFVILSIPVLADTSILDLTESKDICSEFEQQNLATSEEAIEYVRTVLYYANKVTRGFS